MLAREMSGGCVLRDHDILRPYFWVPGIRISGGFRAPRATRIAVTTQNRVPSICARLQCKESGSQSRQV